MAILLVLMPAETEACLRSDVMSALALLGVTTVSFVRDERSLGMVVEGWAFDPITSAEAVMAAVGGRSLSVRTLQPVMEMTLSQGDRR